MTVESGTIVGAESRPDNEVMSRNKHVDEVELQNFERLHDAPEVSCVRCAGWPRVLHALRGERHSARLGRR
jgi:hypothetical protein